MRPGRGHNNPVRAQAGNPMLVYRSPGDWRINTDTRRMAAAWYFGRQLPGQPNNERRNWVTERNDTTDSHSDSAQLVYQRASAERTIHDLFTRQAPSPTLYHYR